MIWAMFEFHDEMLNTGGAGAMYTCDAKPMLMLPPASTPPHRISPSDSASRRSPFLRILPCLSSVLVGITTLQSS